MAIDIKNIVKTNFSIESRAVPIGSYKSVLFVTQPINTNVINAETTVVGGTVSVNQDTFISAVVDTGTYVFSYNGGWTLRTESVTLSDYGITLAGTPATDDVITVVYTVNTSYPAYENAKILFNALGCDSQYIIKVDYNINFSATSVLEQKKLKSGTNEDFIFVVIDPALNSILLQNDTFLNAINLFDSPYKVIISAAMSKASFDSYKSLYENYPIAIKLLEDGNSWPMGICIAAYYCAINLNEDLTMQDYCYTDESAVYQKGIGETIPGTDIAKCTIFNMPNDEYDDYADISNFTDIVGSSIVNFGGNLCNKVSITAYYGMITCDNDIVFAVLDTMLNKQYLTAQGLNNVVSAINSALERYTINGYLEQNSQYGGKTYSETYNGITTMLMREGAILPKGYYVATIPMSRISLTDKKAHKFTPIRVFLQTQSGARVVEINGTVIE